MDIIIILVSLLIASFMLIKIELRDKRMSQILEKSKKDMINLDEITKNIDREYKEPNIDLTKYEREQEESAIISYEELLKSKNNSNMYYDEDYDSKSIIDVKKINLNGNEGSPVIDSKINQIFDNYREEEDFLKALKQLKIDLAR